VYEIKDHIVFARSDVTGFSLPFQAKCLDGLGGMAKFRDILDTKVPLFENLLRDTGIGFRERKPRRP